ncbi:hypothetical protein MBRA1_002124 [Malassezia brasiliensis]|uniref:Uncharacterized protein n=1 Tax=Malassezia brasiliensis TaxID=1821822 RepID=A0AAF0IPZ9_9BASI|nr:hypothetical protein MBRA1_002124 [Malassezia brasiliensis]
MRASLAKVYVAATIPLHTVQVPHFLSQWAAQVASALSHTLGNEPHDGSDAGALVPAGTGFMLPAVPESESLETWVGLLLAAPKKKVSHSRKAMRSANKGLKDRINLVHCPGCARPKLQHHICEHCYGEFSRNLKQKNTGVPVMIPVLPPSALRKLAAAILQLSRDARRNKVVGQLYALAHRRGDDDAGYSWATMVLEGLIQGATDPSRAATEAMELYATLARKGHPQALFGMGRVLLAQIEAAPDTAATRMPRVIELWERSGKNGMPDAWYELGRMYQGTSYLGRDNDRMQECFEQGARAGSTQCCYALGVQQAARADELREQNNTKAAHDAITLSNRYFLQAAQHGHAPSAYNMGLRYLITDAANASSATEEQKRAHRLQWGVIPDDRSAREWFAAAAGKNFMPAMMNYGNMLMNARGSVEATPTTEELATAQRVYRRVLALGMAAQQLRSRETTPRAADDDTPQVMEHMVSEARRALQTLDARLGNGPSQSVF